MILRRLRNSLTWPAVAAVACVLQVIELVRYTGRGPDDYIGIGLFSFTAVAFAIASTGFFIQWRK